MLESKECRIYTKQSRESRDIKDKSILYVYRNKKEEIKNNKEKRYVCKDIRWYYLGKRKRKIKEI